MAPVFVSNVSALSTIKDVAQIPPYTLGYTASKITAMNVPTIECPPATPLFDGTKCVSCPVGQYYLLKTSACYVPIFSSNITALN